MHMLLKFNRMKFFNFIIITHPRGGEGEGRWNRILLDCWARTDRWIDGSMIEAEEVKMSACSNVCFAEQRNVDLKEKKLKEIWKSRSAS